jgi:DNA-directed RNA polymerase specialized sigma subunit
LEEHKKIDEDMKQIIKSLKAPKGLTFLEKVVYFYNRKQGLTLMEIAETTGYHVDYILQISAKLSKKLKFKA